MCCIEASRRIIRHLSAQKLFFKISPAYFSRLGRVVFVRELHDSVTIDRSIVIYRLIRLHLEKNICHRTSGFCIVGNGPNGERFLE